MKMKGGGFMDGFFLVDKPKNMTSQAVVSKIKKQFHLKKCGHSGTLDPDATGVLVVGCDSATKLMKWINVHDKSYIATIIFGYDSNTLDTSGTILIAETMDFSAVEIDNILKSYIGIQEQVPPMVSAIKIAGKKLYEYERMHIKIDPPARRVQIYDIKRLSELRRINNHIEVDLLLKVSKGFYVRSLARDLGKSLGGIAILKELRRIQSGDFTLLSAVPLADIKEEDLLKIEDIFPFPRYEVNDYIAKLVQNGVILDERQWVTNQPFYVVHKNKIIALYEVIKKNQYKPVIIFKDWRTEDENN